MIKKKNKSPINGIENNNKQNRLISMLRYFKKGFHILIYNSRFILILFIVINLKRNNPFFKKNKYETIFNTNFVFLNLYICKFFIKKIIRNYYIKKNP